MPVMNFLSNFLLGTPTDSAKKRERPKVSDEDDDDDDNEQQQQLNNDRRTKVPPPPPPAMPLRRSLVQASSSARARSLSRVYTNVPRDRPDYRTAQQDMIEYYAHLAMMEIDADRVKEEDKNLRESLQGCQVRRYGRLYSRLQIAALCISIGAHTLQPMEDDEDGENAAVPDFKSASLWKDLREQLIIVKSYMLRKDANVRVPILRQGYEEEDEDDIIPDENDELDGVLEKHEMFQDSYQEVLLLIEVQEILASFCEKISSINVQDVADADADDNIGIVKQLENAVDSYEQALQNLFLPQGVADGANVGEETKSHIPTELVGFLLPELYKKPRAAVSLLLRDALAVMSNEECPYSHAQLKTKMKSVLTKWSESILEIPKLVQLGYGGVMAPIVTGDEDDVSSYGVEEDQLLTQKPIDEMDSEPIPLPESRHGRRTSFADPLLTYSGRHVPPQRLPCKSPRSRAIGKRNNSQGRKSPTRNGNQSPPPNSNGDKESDADDDSNTQDPTADADEDFGVAPSTPVASDGRRAHSVVPIRDSDEDIGAPREADSTPSSNSSNRRKRRRSENRSNNDDDLWNDPDIIPPPKHRTYMDWTEDETEAVKEGYYAFGKRWAMIKHNCKNRLSRRTNVQIKDKWRTLVKNGEIEERPDA